MHGQDAYPKDHNHKPGTVRGYGGGEDSPPLCLQHCSTGQASVFISAHWEGGLGIDPPFCLWHCISTAAASGLADGSEDSSLCSNKQWKSWG